MVGLLLGGPAPSVAAEGLVLADGDRIVLLGGGLIEQERRYAFIEARLAGRYPRQSLTFRNLGWSGDTVTGAARTGGFGNPEGMDRLLKEVRGQKPTVILLSYGGNESFAGPAGLPRFRQDYDRLLDHLRPLGARLVLLSPVPHEGLGRPLPDPAEHNRFLEQYTAALKELAASRKLLFVDLFHPLARLEPAPRAQPWTSNGLLPNRHGYWRIAQLIEHELLGARDGWRIELESAGKVVARSGVEVRNLRLRQGSLCFDLVAQSLPPPPPPSFLHVKGPVLCVSGLAPGPYALRIDGREAAKASAQEWGRGVSVEPKPASVQVEELRAAFVKQGELFYRRWRPFNDFAEHWGYIEGDFKAYDEQIARLDSRIAQLRRPAPLHFEIGPARETGHEK
jgi:lysophospholipase L1-like esterase